MGYTYYVRGQKCTYIWISRWYLCTKRAIFESFKTFRLSHYFRQTVYYPLAARDWARSLIGANFSYFLIICIRLVIQTVHQIFNYSVFTPQSLLWLLLSKCPISVVMKALRSTRLSYPSQKSTWCLPRRSLMVAFKIHNLRPLLLLVGKCY